MTAPLDEAGWSALFQECVPDLYAWTSRRAGGDRELAEDVTQETWLRAVDVWRVKGSPEQPRAWLRRVAANLLVNHFRRLEPRAVDPADLDLSAREVEPASADAARLLRWGLARLRAEQARLLEAFHLEGRDVATIAREERLSERAVEGRLRRARLHLRRKLSPYLKATP